MPLLIDGNNLLHAIHALGLQIGRRQLCQLLGVVAEKGDAVHVVFDGHTPPHAYPHVDCVTFTFSGPQEADDVIERQIGLSTAPRRLTVVSTDRRIRKAARKRQCKIVLSEDFARSLPATTAPPKRRARNEMIQKGRAPTSNEAAKWLKEFGFDADGEPSD